MKQGVQGTTPGGAYSPGVIAEGRFVYVSGQGPLRDGELVTGTISEQTRAVMENLGAVLAEAGVSYDGLVGVLEREHAALNGSQAYRVLRRARRAARLDPPLP